MIGFQLYITANEQKKKIKEVFVLLTGQLHLVFKKLEKEIKVIVIVIA